MKIVVIIMMLLNLPACAPIFFGATAATAKVAAGDRSFGSTVDDIAIWSNIKLAYIQDLSGKSFIHIDIKVTKGVVLLTGYTDNEETREKAIQLAWQQNNVNEVINEIDIREITDKLALKEYSLDTWITTQVKTKMFLDKTIKSANYNIETLGKKVYIFGIAQDEEELQKVSNIASFTKYVNHVVNYARVGNNKISPITNEEN